MPCMALNTDLHTFRCPSFGEMLTQVKMSLGNKKDKPDGEFVLSCEIACEATTSCLNLCARGSGVSGEDFGERGECSCCCLVVAYVN